MNIFQNFGSAGLVAITLDDSDSINLKFSDKIVVRVIFDRECPVNTLVVNPAEHVDPVICANAGVIALETETLKTVPVVNGLNPEMKTALPSEIFGNDTENNSLSVTDNKSLSVSLQHVQPMLSDYINESEQLHLSVLKEHTAVENVSFDEKKDEIEMIDFENAESQNLSPSILLKDTRKGGNAKNECESNGVVSQLEIKSSAFVSERSKLKIPFMDNNKPEPGQKCEICNKLFNDKFAFLKHQMVVTSKVKCSKCGRTCQSKAHLLLHEHFAHRHLKNSFKLNPFKCPICLHLCKDSDLISHVKAGHTDEGLYKCCACSSHFQSHPSFKSHLKTHIVSIKETKSTNGVDQITKPTYSDECCEDIVMGNCDAEQPKESKAYKYLRRPPLWNKTWRCGFCERVFRSNGDYVNHMRPSEIVDMCDECHYGSSSKASVLIHQYQKHIKGTDRDKWSHLSGRSYCHICGELCHATKLLDHIMIEHTGEVPFKCCICGTPSQTRKSWTKHGKMHQGTSYNESGLKCDLTKRLSRSVDHDRDKLMCRLCKVHFDCEKDFYLHYKNETDRKDCDICKVSTLTKAGYIVHRYISHGLTSAEGNAVPSFNMDRRLWEEDSPCTNEESEAIKCPCCPESFSVNKMFFHVIESHTLESPFQCCSCKKLLPSVDQYLEHCDFHLGKKPYGGGMCLCRLCNLRFENRDLFKMHRKMHKNICSYCSQEFNSKFLLNIHLQNNHAQKMLSCEICNKKYSSLAQFVDHKRNHYYKKQYQCPICGILVCKLEEHMQQHNPSEDRIISCRICGEQFPTDNALRVHIDKHDPSPNFTCDICKKTLSSKKHLASHAKIHLEHRPLYECVVCGKKCSQRSNLRIHMRIHRSEKAFKCDFCDQGFNYNQSLQIHIKSKHGKDQKNR